MINYSKQIRKTEARWRTVEPGYPETKIGPLVDWLANLKVRIRSSVDWDCTPDWRLEYRRVGDSMWSYVVEGTGTCWVHSPECAWSVRQGQLIIFPRNAVHSFWPDEGVRFRMINLHFDADVYGFADILSLASLHGPVEDDQEQFLFSRNIELSRLWAHRPVGWKRRQEAIFMDVLLWIFEERPECVRIDLAGQVSQNFIRILPVLHELEERYCDPELRVGELASLIALSEVQFRKLFRRALGMGPVAYIQQRRVDEACRRLKRSSDTVEQIGAACGFESKQFFHRVFKKLKGMTPGTFREQIEW